MPRLLASDGFKLTSNNGLKTTNHSTIITTNTIAKISKSTGRILNKSPIKYVAYLLKPPLEDKMTIPRATAEDENTPMMVSVEAVFALLTLIMASVISKEKAIMVPIGLLMPKSTPMAIPVSAEWPRASEKNDILLLTVIVPNMPSKGLTSKIPINAFFIKL